MEQIFEFSFESGLLRFLLLKFLDAGSEGCCFPLPSSVDLLSKPLRLGPLILDEFLNVKGTSLNDSLLSLRRWSSGGVLDPFCRVAVVSWGWDWDLVVIFDWPPIFAVLYRHGSATVLSRDELPPIG